MHDPTPSDEWQGERLRDFRAALQVRRARQAAAGLVFVAAAVLTLAVSFVLRLPESWWIPAVGALAALALVFRLANWKCPGCGERLSGRAAGDHCPGCGAPLD